MACSASACSTWLACWQVRQVVPCGHLTGGSHPHSVPLLHTGSLTVSITDMRAPVVGGSGGVYALCSAHLANVVMVMGQPGWGEGRGPQGFAHSFCFMPHQNWAGMRCPYKLLRMVLALVCSK